MSNNDARGKDKIIEEAGVPVAKEFGEHSEGIGKELAKTTDTAVRAVNVLLAPIRGVVWGAEKVQEKFVPRLAAKLERVPEDRRIPPDLLVAGPTIQALKFAGEKEELRELFANLLVTAMDSDTAKFAHPAYVEIIKQLSPDEANILAYIGRDMEARDGHAVVEIRQIKVAVAGLKVVGQFETVERNLSLLGREAGCEHGDLVPIYIDNLCRLEILTWVPDGQYLSGEENYEALMADQTVQAALAKHGEKATVYKRALILSEFGKQFISACASP